MVDATPETESVPSADTPQDWQQLIRHCRQVSGLYLLRRLVRDRWDEERELHSRLRSLEDSGVSGNCASDVHLHDAHADLGDCGCFSAAAPPPPGPYESSMCLYAHSTGSGLRPRAALSRWRTHALQYPQMSPRRVLRTILIFYGLSVS